MTQPSTEEVFYRGLVGPYVPHQPSERQTHALLQMERSEILYGGAAGGGKTDWLLMEALRYVTVPGYNALLLRRTYPELYQSGGLIPRSIEWLSGTDAKYSSSKNMWAFPSGATLTFGHMQRETDKYQYQGGEYQMIGFDELTHFTESQYKYLFSRRRKTTGAGAELDQVPLRTRGATNPGGPGHDWVKARFRIGDEADPPPTRTFVPAKLADNPYIDESEYTEALMELDPFERAQLLSGDWDASPAGALFQRDWFSVVEALPDHPEKRIRFWDLAATEKKLGEDPDYTVGTLLSHSRDHVLIEDVRRFREAPGKVDEAILRAAEEDGLEVPIWIEEQPGAAGKFLNLHFRDLLMGYDVHFAPATGNKRVRANPFASHAQHGGVSVLRAPWNDAWFAEVLMFDSGLEAHDDQVDSASGGFQQLALARGVSPEDLYSLENRPDLEQFHEFWSDSAENGDIWQ